MLEMLSCGFSVAIATFFENGLPRGLPFGAKVTFNSSLQALTRSPGAAVLLSITSTRALRMTRRVDCMAFLLGIGSNSASNLPQFGPL